MRRAALLVAAVAGPLLVMAQDIPIQAYDKTNKALRVNQVSGGSTSQHPVNIDGGYINRIVEAVMVQPTSGALFNLDAGTVTAFQGGAWNVTSMSPAAGAVISIDGGIITVRGDISAQMSAGTIINVDGGTITAEVSGSGVRYFVDPCEREAKTVYPVDIVTATTTEIANQVASEYFYVCSINLVTAGANNVAIVEDDSDTCASPTAGLNGGVTAGEGWNFAANGGIALGNGASTVMKTGTANRYWCIITSAAVQLSGTITYVSAP